MRLIDADALEFFSAKIPDEYDAKSYIEGAGLVLDKIDDAPTIDAVPVVRCKDCIHAVDITNWRYAARFGDHAKQCMRCRGDSGFGYYDLSVVYPDGFCDEGEKRNDQP